MRLIYNTDRGRLQRGFKGSAPATLAELFRAERAASAPVELYLTDDGGGFPTPGTTEFELVLGRDVAISTGTVAITWTTGTTAAIDLSQPRLAARIESALNAVAEVDTAGGVDVTEIAPGRVYAITFRSAGARALATAALDSPQPDGITIAELAAGSGSTRARQILSLDEGSLAAVGTADWTATSAPALVVAVIAAGTAETRKVVTVEVTGEPAPGSYFILNNSAPIPVDATAAEFAALFSLAESAEKIGERKWQATFAAGITTAVVEGTHNLVRRPGLTATLSLDTAELLTYRPAELQCSLLRSGQNYVRESVRLSAPSAAAIAGTTPAVFPRALFSAGPPTTGDDAADGFGALSVWLDSATPAVHFLVDNSTGAAVWQRMIHEAQRDVANGFAGLNGDGELAGIIINRTGTAAALSAIVLAEGEIAYATDTKAVYKGDGVTAGGIQMQGSLSELGIIGAADQVVIGTGAVGGVGYPSVSIGKNSFVAYNGVAIGDAARSDFGGYAIGDGAQGYQTDAFQLGPGTNSTVSTIQFMASGPVTAAQFGALATLTASLAAKAPLASPTFTGTIATPAAAMSGQSVAGAAATSLLDLSTTWNTTGAPSAIKLDVTDTASAADSKLLWLGVNGGPRLTLSKAGFLNLSTTLSDASDTHQAFIIDAGGAVAGATIPTQLSLKNTDATAGAYANEVHLRMQSDKRRYIDWYNAAGVLKWNFGINAINRLIVSDTTLGHRMFMDSPIGGDGFTSIMSKGVSPVVINGVDDSGTESYGTGGFRVDSGIYPSRPLFTVEPLTASDAALKAENNGSGFAPASLLLTATQAASRGQGIFHYNTLSDTSWFTGVAYNTSGAKWMVGYESNATWDPNVAALDRALFTIQNNGNAGYGTASPDTRLDVAGALTLREMAAPGVAIADGLRLYAEDDGAGKTRLMVIFQSGAAQQLAIAV